MLFVTNRFPSGSLSIRTEIGREFTFDLSNTAPSNSVFFCERSGSGAYTEQGNKQFFQKLKDSKYKQILLYCHGFNTLPEEAFSTANDMQKLFDMSAKNEILVVPLVWPCDNADDNNQIIVTEYWNDHKSAEMSALSFARVFDKFLNWQSTSSENDPENPCFKRINMLTHSLGAKVLRGTLDAWNQNDLPRGVPMIFRNVFLVAADIVNEALEKGQLGQYISHSARNVVVYHASDDLALRASKALNLKYGIASRRLGHSGPEDMSKVPKNIYAVDCDDVNTKYNSPFGHAYFTYDQSKTKPGLVFEHILACLKTGRVATDAGQDKILII